MPFNSLSFIFLFGPLFFIVYYVGRSSWRNSICLLFSFIFYAWAEPLFIFVALGSSVLDHLLVRCLAALPDGPARRLITAVAVAQGLLILLYFKYAAFLYGVVTQLLGLDLKPSTLFSPVLPLAISFIVFEKITYVVDNYRGTGRPARSLVDYLTYVFLFPKLIAGPIVKYHEIEPYLLDHRVRFEDFQAGLLRFALGLTKKVLIADQLALPAEAAFAAAPGTLSSDSAWLGIVCFTFQIYFDFSGYSDMAIGMARMMGFPLRENFNQPYLATSFTDFWHRWHISLSTWIRDYLYIPLGGNRVPEWRVYFNLVICFVLSGLWHGANWTFLFWGLYHGIFLICDRIGLVRALRGLPVAIQIAATFFLVMMGWVLFRSPTFEHALAYYGALLGARDVPPSVFPEYSTLLTLGAAATLSFLPAPSRWPDLLPARLLPMALSLSSWLIAACFLWTVTRVAAATFTPFLYFRF